MNCDGGGSFTKMWEGHIFTYEEGVSICMHDSQLITKTCTCKIKVQMQAYNCGLSES